MSIHALFRSHQEWQGAPLEVSLLKGLPALHVLGINQRLIREWLPKFKVAFRAQGWEWPRTKQIVIQVRAPSGAEPVGLELALAAAIAHATNQIQLPEGQIYCGDVSLEGEVSAIPALHEVTDESLLRRLITGKGMIGSGVATLSDLDQPEFQHQMEFVPELRPPTKIERQFSLGAALALKIVALGEHPIMIAGPQGSGKTTWVESLIPLLEAPRNWTSLWRTHKGFGEEITWRPYLSPHHSSSALAILGGGQPPRPGEISKAHGGVLFLDEYLEFDARVQEALREPLERGSIRVARGSRAKVFPSHFLLVAATNLCFCGRLSPGGDYQCQFSLSRCRSHVERLSGPMLDRFHILSLSHEWRGKRQVWLSEVEAEIFRAREWRAKMGFDDVAAKRELSSLHDRLSGVAKMVLPQEEESERRQIATLRVASTVADLGLSPVIEAHHVAQAKALAISPFLEMGRIFA